MYDGDRFLRLPVDIFSAHAVKSPLGVEGKQVQWRSKLLFLNDPQDVGMFNSEGFRAETDE